ncbi:MAG: M20/M25/M40 family metallo-hydrolase [Oligoflexia bacterium]|nr:M20/M25/M40 family metallo-hydrolase [Oligoflexia bacterium]
MRKLKARSAVLGLISALLLTSTVTPALGFPIAGSGVSLLEQLASPEFEGRGVGTQGLGKARDLLATELALAGLMPGFSIVDRGGAETGRSFTRSFPVFTGNELGANNGFAGSTAAEFVPLSFSRSGSVENTETVFVGYGISFRGEEGFAYDDYEGLDVRGRIVIVMLGDPSLGNRGSVFRNPAYYHYSTPMYKVQNAELHGAAGIVLVRDALSLNGALEPALRFQGRQGGGATLAILAGQARIELVERLLGRSVSELQAGIAREQKPGSFIVLSGEEPARLDLAVDLKRQVGNVENVTALLPGTDPALASEYVVIGAHYDHLGYGGDSSMDPAGVGRVHPGADDNASGVQAVIEMAARIRALGGNRRPVLFAFFTAEEIGLLGSKNWVESLPLPQGARAAFMLNLDMVGRMQGRKLSVLATASAGEFKPLLEEVRRDFDLELQTADSGFGSSDHASFLRAQVPALFFTTGAHEDYHRPSDTADKINHEGLRAVEDFAFAVWRALDARTEAPVFDPASQEGDQPSRPGRGYGVYFGSVPEFEQSEVPGVLLSGVRAGSPAEQAGLQKGDILTGLGEIEIRSINDLVFALRFYRPNDEVEVRWLRLGVPMKAMTVLRSRDS